MIIVFNTRLTQVARAFEWEVDTNRQFVSIALRR